MGRDMERSGCAKARAEKYDWAIIPFLSQRVERG